MKALPVILLISAAALPQLASADLAVTNPAGLGQVRAFLDFCARVAPQNAASFKAEWRSIVGDESALLAQIEKNASYQHEYTGFTSELGKLPRGETAKICAVSAASWNGTASKGDGGSRGDDGDRKRPKDEKRDERP